MGLSPMLVIKVGMQPEADIARSFFPEAQVLSGAMTPIQLEQRAYWTATKIVSFGLCGGLKPGVKVGEALIAAHLRTPEGTFDTGNHGVPWFSDGKFNQANTPAQREYIYKHTGAWAIDDESYSVAIVAARRKIPFSIARVVSDQWDQDVQFTANLLSPTGGINFGNVTAAVLKHPLAMLRIWNDYNTSMKALKLLAQRLAPGFNT